MKPKKTSGPRNPVATSPLMRKGGPHGRSRSAQRQAERRQLTRELTQGNDTGPSRKR